MSDYGFWARNDGEVTQEELEERYDSALDEMGDVSNGTWSWSASYALKELDPIAYRVGLSDYHNALIEGGEIVEEMEDEED